MTSRGQEQVELLNYSSVVRVYVMMWMMMMMIRSRRKEA
jgi:predicted DNA-binding ribbon-helix-helix protein